MIDSGSQYGIHVLRTTLAHLFYLEVSLGTFKRDLEFLGSRFQVNIEWRWDVADKHSSACLAAGNPATKQATARHLRENGGRKLLVICTGKKIPLSSHLDTAPRGD
jgi:hypothetical protein